MKKALNNKIRKFVENGDFVVRQYSEDVTSLRKRMKQNDYNLYIRTAFDIFVFTTLETEIEIPLKDFEWKMLWNKLGDIPTNGNAEIEETFLHFDIGTETTDIWEWFEWFFGITLGDEIYK